MGKEAQKAFDEEPVSHEDSRALYVLNRLGASVHRSLKIEDVLNAAAECVLETIPWISAAEIYLLDENQKTLFLKVQRGLSPAFVGTGTSQLGEGIVGSIAKSSKSAFIEALTKDRRVDVKAVRKEGLSSYGGIPLVWDEAVLGVLGVYTKDPHHFDKSETRLFDSIGRRVGTAIHNAVEYEQADRKTRRYTTVSRAIAVTRQLRTIGEVLQDITKVLVQSLGFDFSWIGLVNDYDRVLEGKAAFGAGTGSTSTDAYRIASRSWNPPVMAVQKRRPIVYQFINDVKDDAFRDWLVGENVQSCGYIPILSGDRALGVIGVFYRSDQAFEGEDVKTLMSVAEQAAIAIENARLYEQMKTSEERYRTLFETTGTSLVILDRDLSFRLVNHAFESLSGYDRSDLIGKRSFKEFITARDRTGNPIESKFEAPTQSWETPFAGRNRKIKQVHITTSQIPGSSHVLVSISDMTRERELERRLFRSEELAAIGELSAGIAHEIRNPLVAITTSVSLLRDEPQISEEGRQLLDIVKEESDHLAAIVDDFLRFARPKKPTFKEEDLCRLLKDTVKKHKDRDGKKARWVERYDEKIPPVALDRHQIQQVLTNLMLNSLDAIEEGGIIEVKTEKQEEGGEDRVCVMIRDTGTGIPSDEISKIFQPFYSTKEKGTGMGLAICRRIVSDHEGEIFVESRDGVGTTFSVVLPMKQGKV